MKQEKSLNAKQKRKSRKPASSEAQSENSNSVSELAQLQLVICQQLQRSLDVTELLNIYTEALPTQNGITSISFAPAFQTLSADEKASTPQSHLIRLFTGQDYIGQLKIEFDDIPSIESITIAEATATLVAFPLRHAMEYQEALKNSELDSLTNLKNRKAMDHALRKACDASKRYGFPASILMLDIDHFKKINDNYGHITGDKILQRLASVIQQSCRLADEGFRFGGEEFLMLLPNTTETGAIETAERLRKSIEMNDFGGLIKEKDLPITISIGISTHEASDSMETFVEKTDQALYSAKHNGRNQSMKYSELYGNTKTTG